LKYWDAPDGTKTNTAVLQENLDKSIQISNGASQAEIDRSYLTDRRDLRYNLISGLGQYAPAFIKDADAQTDFNAVPDCTASSRFTIQLNDNGLMRIRHLVPLLN